MLLHTVNNNYLLFLLNPNTFHQLFQHSTQPRLDKLISFITEFHKLNGVSATLVSLALVMIYLTELAYVILAHILYLLTYILGFNVIQLLYVKVVKVNLIEFMAKIVKMLVERSIEVLTLMNKLIKKFCGMINYIFIRIKAKLIFYLIHLELQIYVDMLQLSDDIASFNKLLMELQSEVRKYMKILETVKVLLNKIITFPSNIRILKKYNNKFVEYSQKLIQNSKKIINQFDDIFFNENHKISKTLNLLSYINIERSIKSKDGIRELFDTLKNYLEILNKKTTDRMKINIQNSFISKFQKGLDSIKNILDRADHEVSNEIIKVIENTKRTIDKLYKTLSDQNNKIPKILDSLSSIKLEKHIQSRSDIKDIVPTLKKDLQELSKHSSDITTMTVDLSTINKFQKEVKAIKIILKMIQKVDPGAPKQFNYIIERLDVLEPINLPKLLLLITQIQMLHLIITARVYLLVCTILFYQEIKQTMDQMFGLMKFECSDCHGFLSKCSEVEKNGQSICQKIEECIKKLRQACDKSKSCLGVPTDLLNLYSKIIDTISRLKFYVDLIAREILIFKTIILTLIEMTVSSAILDGLIKVIGNITDIDNAIPTLISVHGYLRAFYFIQLLNTMTIFALSSALKFSESIHHQYRVLLFNLDLINRLIWVIECYIQHLIVFKYTSVSLNSQIENIVKELKIITEINHVGMSMFKITDKLVSINDSIKQLNEIQDSMNILNWKEKSKGIRHQTQSINTNVREIDSEIKYISGYIDNILKSWIMLKYLENFLKVLILEVVIFIEDTNKRYNLGVGIRNKYYGGVILSVLGPCNKQLMYIFWYLLVMLAVMENLINIVHRSVGLIIEKMGFLYGLTKILQEDVNKIDRGVVDVECAIEGVTRNLIRCSTKLLSVHIISLNRTNINVHR